MHYVKITPKNFDSILNQSISRLRRASNLRELEVDERSLLVGYDIACCLGRSLSYDNKVLREFLENYCYGTSTFDK